MSNTRRRGLYAVSIFALVLNLVGGAFFSVTSAAPINDTGSGGPSVKTWLETTHPQDIAKGQLYADWVYYCFSLDTPYDINTSGLNNGEIGNKDLATSIGQAVSSESCKTIGYMGPALKFLGIPMDGPQDYANFICKIGATRHATSADPNYKKDPCTDLTLTVNGAGPDWTVNRGAASKVKAYINDVVGGDIFTPSAITKYMFYYNLVFRAQCESQEASPGAESQGHSYVKVLKSDGSFDNKFFIYNENAKVEIPVGSAFAYERSPGGATNYELKCADVVKQVNELATVKTSVEWTTFIEANPGATPKGSGGNPSNGGTSTNEAVCTGGTLGWLLCGIVSLLKNVNDAISPEIEKQLLVGPLTQDNQYTQSITPIWRTIVGFANLLLVIAFLIVIFSQATSFGLSAYGIKKILPRIVAAAVLINLSFFICTITLDIANVIGGSVKSIIQVGLDAITVSDLTTTDSGQIMGTVGAAVLGGGALLVTGTIGFVVPIALAAVMGLLAIFVGLAIRKVLLVLMIIVGPLAFAAMVLPGTEQYFKKWLKSYIGLLAMYPVIIAILYGCALVAKIILVAGGHS